MAKREILAGATDQTIDVFIQDSSSTTGAGLTGLAFNSAGLTCYYRKGATGSATALTLATQTVGGAHSDGGFVQIDSTNMPGTYRLDLSDTIVATAGMVTIYLRGATNMVPCVAEIEVVSVNKFDSVRMGLTALPNAAAEAAGGLYTRGTGAGQINQAANGLIDVNVENWNTTAVPAEHTAGYPIVTVKDGTGTGEINTNAGAIALVDLVTTTTTATNLTNAPPDSAGVTTLLSRIPAALFSGITSLAQWLGMLAGKQTGNATALTEIRATGAGSGTFDPTTDSEEAIRDRGDAAWTTATGFSTHSAADVWSSATRTLTSAANITSTGGTTVPQTGDSFARIGATGSGLTSLAQASVCTEARLAELDAANIPADVDQLKADNPNRPTRGVQFDNLMFMMVDATDLNTPETGVTVTATISKDGGAFAACTNSVSEVSGGWYKITLTATEMTADSIALKFTGTGCAQRNIHIRTQPT